jgi:hypothetical protein
MRTHDERKTARHALRWPRFNSDAGLHGIDTRETISLAGYRTQELSTLEARPVQREYCFSETIEAMCCQDQLIMSAATDGPYATE